MKKRRSRWLLAGAIGTSMLFYYLVSERALENRLSFHTNEGIDTSQQNAIFDSGNPYSEDENFTHQESGSPENEAILNATHKGTNSTDLQEGIPTGRDVSLTSSLNEAESQINKGPFLDADAHQNDYSPNLGTEPSNQGPFIDVDSHLEFDSITTYNEPMSSGQYIEVETHHGTNDSSLDVEHRNVGQFIDADATGVHSLVIEDTVRKSTNIGEYIDPNGE